MEQLLAELAADASEALEHDALAEAARERIRAKLPAARKAGAGPAKLERTIKSIYVQGTISRWTAGDAPKGAPHPKRKRPGAAPNGS